MSTNVDVLTVLDSLQWGFNHRRCPMCAGWNMSESGETDKVHTKDCEVVAARVAVANLIDKAQFIVDGLDEDYVAWPTRALMLKAALARCTGAKQ